MAAPDCADAGWSELRHRTGERNPQETVALTADHSTLLITQAGLPKSAAPASVENSAFINTALAVMRTSPFSPGSIVPAMVPALIASATFLSSRRRSVSVFPSIL